MSNSKPELSHFEAIRNVGRLRRIVDAVKLLNSTIDLAELTSIILKIVREEVGVDRGSVFVVDGEHNEIRSVVAQEVEGTEIRVRIGNGIAGTVAKTGEIIDNPHLPENIGGVQISASSTMCEAVGGDYLDYYPLTDGRFIVMLGDVSGKGIGAALVMTSLHATCRALLRHVHSLERIALILNETLVETTRVQTFVTLIAVLVDTVGGRLHCVCAGHNPPLVVDAEGNNRWLERGGGPPVGLFANMKLAREIYEIPHGSSVIIYTDGVTEAEDETEEQFGMERLNAVVCTHHTESAAEIHSAIRGSLQEFIGERQPGDDSTLIVLKF